MVIDTERLASVVGGPACSGGPYDGPAFSQDGRQIAFRSNRDGHWQLYVMNSDGSNQRNLSKSEADDNWFWWSLDGTQIYVESMQGQDFQNLQGSAAIVNVDGWGQKPFPLAGNLNWRP